MGSVPSDVMITVRPQKQLQQAKQYFREHLSQGDYHAEKQTVAGRWFGAGAERLGLDLRAAVGEEAFLRLCDNLHPVTGVKLTARTRKERRVFYDFVISAPKSISVMALTIGHPPCNSSQDRTSSNGDRKWSRNGMAKTSKD